MALETDEGLIGYGEVCPLGAAYLPSYATGARTGIYELAPQLIGLNPIQTGFMNQYMDRILKGHPYVKSAIDIACWDILGKACDLPCCDLLGGRYGDDFVLYRAISQQTPNQMAERVSFYRDQGYRRFQLKVGSDVEADVARIKAASKVLTPGDILVADANTGWLPHEATRVLRELRDVDVYIEQPCARYEDCLRLKQEDNHPFVLDETIDCIAALLRASSDNAMDVVNLKISKVGGLTKAMLLRDVCISLDIAMTIEDSWGSDIITAAIAHLAHSTPPEYLFSAADFNSYVTLKTAEGAPERATARGARVHPVEHTEQQR